ncbi:unnamed protein product [Periconia digitata]|uniref:Uncharacterized protein n=1 Tax=Periconia digitata TaxID=1303443 RepID=A0A9W4ULD7_9PLEO|nr:unnamed protein product [Periconia digitata]
MAAEAAENRHLKGCSGFQSCVVYLTNFPLNSWGTFSWASPAGFSPTKRAIQRSSARVGIFQVSHFVVICLFVMIPGRSASELSRRNFLHVFSKSGCFDNTRKISKLTSRVRDGTCDQEYLKREITRPNPHISFEIARHVDSSPKERVSPSSALTSLCLSKS